MNDNRHYSSVSVWGKYVPVIRILLKRSAALEQTLGMNRADFERAGYVRKSGYKFIVTLNKSKPNIIFAGNEFVQSFISVLQDDAVIQELLVSNDYTFTFTGKFMLSIKNNKLPEQEIPAYVTDETS
jgi:hypothetical protein